RPAHPRGERERLRALRVVAERPRLVGFIRIDLRERGAVDDEVCTERRHAAEHRVMIADVEVGVRQRGHVVMSARRGEERAAEPPARPGDDDPHTTPCRPFPARGAVTMSWSCARYNHSRWSRYHETVSARPSSKAIAGDQPSPRNRSAETPYRKSCPGRSGTNAIRSSETPTSATI